MKDDSLKAKALYEIVQIHVSKKQFEKAKTLAEQNLELSKKIKYYRGVAASYGAIGNAYFKLGSLDKGIEFSLKSLEEHTKIRNKRPAAVMHGQIGNIYYRKGLHPKALEHFLEALKCFEELNSKTEIAGYSGNIGAIYERRKEFDKALQHYEKSLKINKEIDRKQGIAINLICIANVYTRLKNDSIALSYHLDALKINEELNDKEYLANNYSNIGSTEMRLGNFDKAIEYHEKALTISEVLKNKESILTNYNAMGIIKQKQKKYSEAQSYYTKALALAKETGSYEDQADSHRNLYIIYEKTENFALALEHYKTYMAFKDSMFNEKTNKQILEKQLQFEYEKKEAINRSEFEKQQALQRVELDRKQHVLAMLEKENELKELNLSKSALALKQEKAESEAQKKQVEILNKDVQLKEAESKQKNVELQREKIFRNAMIVGALLFLCLSFVVLRSLRQSKKANKIIAQQKQEVESQKHIVEEKNKEITDSITYARRLQDAILPPQEFVDAHLPENFIFYQPKDIVAGDFFWMHTVESYPLNVKGSERITNNPELILFAAADSTGHGVPGALVSVVCSNALNRSVNEFGLTDPGEILDKTRKLVLETFSKSDKDVKDGMDISLVAISRSTHSVFHSVQWAGANNPLWYIEDNELKEITPDKQPIGKIDNPKNFTTHRLNLKKGSVIYLLTDGYADQFGGPKGKKYKYKQLKEILLKVHSLPPQKQKEELSLSFNTWKGSLEQVDDVTLMGIRL
jgi:tetratricopeptide (TPR) repeat protein